VLSIQNVSSPVTGQLCRGIRPSANEGQYTTTFWRCQLKIHWPFECDVALIGHGFSVDVLDHELPMRDSVAFGDVDCVYRSCAR
jgi:hypothetical protein